MARPRSGGAASAAAGLTEALAGQLQQQCGSPQQRRGSSSSSSVAHRSFDGAASAAARLAFDRGENGNSVDASRSDGEAAAAGAAEVHVQWLRL